MADPLSTATRATKRNLLLASVVAISANAFNVSVDRIPLGGLSITFDDRLFAFLLVIVLLYFLATFILYYLIDIKNLELTSHQKVAEEYYSDRILKFPEQIHQKMVDEMRSLLPEGFNLGWATEPRLHGDDPQPGECHIFRTRGPGENELTRERNAELFHALDAVQERWISGLRRARLSNTVSAKAYRYTVGAMYWTRNYVFDGALPIVLGSFALVSLFAHWDLSWIQGHLPSFKEFKSH